MAASEAISPAISGRRGTLAGWLKNCFSFPVFLAAILAAGACVAAHTLFVDPDTWWHIRVGDLILRSGTWPTHDMFSFSVPGAGWIAYEWLGEVVFALAWRLGGFVGLAAIDFLLAGTIAVLLYVYSTLRSGKCKAACVVVSISLPVLGAFFTLRPQLLGYVFLLTTMILMERFRQGLTKRLWVLPAIFLVWVNTHGTFVLGAIVVGVYLLSGLFKFQAGGIVAVRWTPEQRRHILLVMLLCMLVAPITPYGSRLAAYPLQMAFMQPVNLAIIMEWQPMSFNEALGKVFLAIMLGYFLIQVTLRISYRLETIALLIFAIFSTCIHIRFLLFFLFLFIPLLAEALARWADAYKPEKDLRLLNAAVMALLVFAGVKYLSHPGKIAGEFTKSYPAGAVAYLKEHPLKTPLFNDYGWGGYLIWSQMPRSSVFVDGRADFYEYGGVLADYLSITHLKQQTPFLLRKYSIGACLIEPESPLATYLSASPDWHRAYADGTAVLFVRQPQPGAGSLSR
jgi:hypothetical protein